MEDAASTVDQAAPTQSRKWGRKDMTEPDMWKHTGPPVWALGCACNTCFPYCLFIASWTSQSIGKATEKEHKGRWLLFFLLGDMSVP